jgi:hypothetical protein
MILKDGRRGELDKYRVGDNAKLQVERDEVIAKSPLELPKLPPPPFLL